MKSGTVMAWMARAALPLLIASFARPALAGELDVFLLADLINKSVKQTTLTCPSTGPAAPAPSYDASPVGSANMAIGGYQQTKGGLTRVVNGCAKDSKIRFGYNSDQRCDKIIMNPKFADHMNKHLFRCSVQAAAAAGLPQPSGIFINHVGCYNYRVMRGGRSLSLHAHARALDIGAINLKFPDGSSSKMSMHKSKYKGANAKFYDALRSCWKSSLSCGKGSIGIPKSSMGGNSDHNDHLHLEYPKCMG